MEKVGAFVLRFGGVSSVGFLTYLGEYMSYIVALAFISDKLTLRFQLGLSGFALVGTISGLYLILSGLIAVPIGHLCDRYGRRPFAILGSILGAIALFSLIIIDQLTGVLEFLVGITISLGALGVGHGTYSASTLAYTGDVATPESLGKPYGLVELAEFAGFAFGPPLGGLVAFELGRTPTFAISGVLLLLAGGIAALFMPEAEKTILQRTEDIHFSQSVRLGPEESVSNQYRQGAHSSGWAGFLSKIEDSTVGATILTTFVASLAFTGFFFYLPLYAFSLRDSIPIFGAIYPIFGSIGAGTGVLSMIPFGHLEDSSQRRLPFLVGGLTIGAVSLGSVFAAPSLLAFVLGSFVFGLSLAMIRVSQLVILAERTGFESRAAVMGTNHAVEHAGFGVGAIVGGSLAAVLGLANVFLELALVLLAAAIAFLSFGTWKKVK